MSSPRQLSNEVIISTLAKFKVTVTPDQIRAIREYIDLLLLWNQKISLTSITDPLEILSRHFGESMFAAHAIPDLHGRLADVGSGPGFPGLALKIIRPDLEVFVIESVIKKATFLAEVSRHLNLTGVKVVVSRFEDLADDLAPLDFICARALGNRNSLLQWAIPNLNIDGRVVLWLGSEALTLSTPIDASSSLDLGSPKATDPTQNSPAPERGSAAAALASASPRVNSSAPPLTSTPGHSGGDQESIARASAPSALDAASPSTTSPPSPGEPSVGQHVPNLAPTLARPAASRVSTWRWSSPIQIPESTSRHLIVGKPHNR